MHYVTIIEIIDTLNHHYMPGSTMHYITAAHRKAVFILLDSIDFPTMKHYLFHQFQANNMELWEMLEHINASYGGHPADLRNELNNLEFGAKDNIHPFIHAPH
eukprot:366098-Chlamydomonas_euryale.AAC.6